MKTAIRKKMMVFFALLAANFTFGQNFTINSITDSAIYTPPCDSVVTLDFWVAPWISSQNVDHAYLIDITNPTQQGTQILITVNWGDGTTNTYTGFYISPTVPLIQPGLVEHIYPSSPGSNYTISVTASNPIYGSSATNSDFVFTSGCNTLFYGNGVLLDCDSNGMVDSTINDVPILVTSTGGNQYTFNTSTGIWSSLNLPDDNYTLTIDPVWLEQNNFTIVSISPTSINVQGSYALEYNIYSWIVCDSIPPVQDGCFYGQIFCDNNNDGILNGQDYGVYNAPVSLSYDGQTLLTYTDPNGFYNFNATNGNQSIGVVSVDANWLGQNGYQFTSNTFSDTIQPCQTGSPSMANFPVNCTNAQTPTECIYAWVFCDENGNGTLDSNEVVLPFAPVVVTGNSGYATTLYSDSLGFVSYSSQAYFGGIVVLTVPQWWLDQNGYSMSNNAYTLITDCNNPTPAYLGINCQTNACADLWTSVSPYIGYFQNQNNYIKLKWGNNGPQSTTCFTLTLTLPQDVIINTSSIAYPNYVISGNTITWTFGPGSSYIYQTDIISFFVPAGFPSGTVHTFSSSITPIGSTQDCNSINNEGSLCMILGNSYDPNDKSTSLPPVIDPAVQDVFTYVIRFQNTGTAPAQDVYIIDTLSPLLDWSTLQVISTSHNMQLVDLGNGVMKFNFPGIWLPDSTANEPESHGDVVFRIKEHFGNGNGTSIENTAHIFFDWNPAIVTNTVVNTNQTLGIHDSSIEQLAIYPNPTQGFVRISASAFIDGISIVNLTGQIVMETGIIGFGKEIDLKNLEKGVYLVKVFSGNKTETLKLIVE